ncbi:hypothetical protein [Halalkalicoccus ordinarius]|uniref:hypothetical protein n=1 Tax=Halalkalicoccus ordinarius TaxID=3116651 RepID=UPI00300E7960
MSGSDAPGRREVAHRLFAAEFDAADLEYADSDEERAPKYVIVPTGARVNRLFVVGVLTELERVNEEVVRARVVDPTGAFVVYAGQYQPDALAFLERTEPPAFVAVTGKANAFQPEDSDRVFTSIRPESVAEVDAETRDRWTVQAAAHTLDRIAEFAQSFEVDGGDLEEALIEAGLDSERASGIALARDHYGTTPAYLDALRESALDAARQVAGEVDSVDAPGIAPDEDDGRETSISELQGSVEAAPTAVDTEDEPVTAHEPEESGSEPATGGSEPSEAEIEAKAETTAPEPEAVEPDATHTSETGTGPGEGEQGPSGSAVGRDVDAEASAETETKAESEPTTEGTTDDLGDFEPSGSTSTEESEPETASEPDAEATPASDEPTAAADEEAFYELDDEERAEVEEEFGVDFSTGGEVDEPGEAGIDVPDADELADLEAQAETETEEVSAGAPEEDAEAESEDEEEGSDVNVEDAAMETMRELAGGDGADRSEVVSRVAEEHGVDADAVDDAIESALMSGRCYEPQDGVLKPI